MRREELLSSKEYWLSKIQIDLFNKVEDYIEQNKLSRNQLADQLNVSEDDVNKILNGDADFAISKLVELCLAMGVAPQFTFAGK